MFGIDDAVIGSLVTGAISGGASLIGGSNSNAATAQQSMWNNIGNANLQQASMKFNDQQGQLGRIFADQQVTRSQTFNDAELNKAQAFNSQEAQKQRDYETQMSSTAYQRAMADMKKAGLNPMLAYQQGGASTPSGATASSPSASAGIGSSSNASVGTGGLSGPARMADVISPAVSSAFQGAQAVLGLKRSAAEIANIDADTKNKDAGPSGTIPAARRAINDIMSSDAVRNTGKAVRDAIPGGNDAPAKTSGIPGVPGVLWSDPFAGLPNYDDAKKAIQPLVSWLSPGTTSFSPGNPGTTATPNHPHSPTPSPLTSNQLLDYAKRTGRLKYDNRLQ